MIRRHLANTVTISRILMAATIAVFASHPQLSFWLFMAALGTDFVDGPLARRLGSVSRFGRKLDVTADLLLLVVVLVSLPLLGWPPPWFLQVSAGGFAVGLIAIKSAGPTLRRYLGWMATLAFIGFYALVALAFARHAYGGHLYYYPALALGTTLIVWFYHNRIAAAHQAGRN